MFIHSSFICGMHHYECVAPDVDVSLHSGRFSGTSVRHLAAILP